MARSLDVYLNQKFVGQLIQNDGGQLVFSYAENYVAEFGAMPLSLSLPIRKEPFAGKECRGFFSGILPEGEKRETIARNLGISARNDFSMLEQIGGECAGAVTFMPAGAALPEEDLRYRELSDNQLANILRELPRRPLMAGEDGIRLSLAGAQDKLAVRVSGDRISLPLGNAPSTHILKPAVERFEGVVFNEALCMTLAGRIGLPTAKVEKRSAEDIDYLLVERYDRKEFLIPIGPGQGAKYKKRLHQEDFCQAMGIASENKYQREDGPSLKDCFALLRDSSSAPLIDLQRLLDAVIYNYLIGNNDAHGKNFSLTYDAGTLLTGIEVRLAPLYDIVCTAYYPDLSKNMAMNLGGEYRSDLILPLHFEGFAEETGLAKPLVRKRVNELANAVLENLEHIDMAHASAKGVADFIRAHNRRIADQFKN